MTRKDFELIAETIHFAPGLSPQQRWNLAQSFAERLANTNLRFDRSKFLAASAPEPVFCNICGEVEENCPQYRAAEHDQDLGTEYDDAH